MKKKYITGLIIIDAVIGFTVMWLNFTTDSLSIYNFLVFLFLVYLYYKGNNNMFIPYFILEFFVFTLILINRLAPKFLNDNDPFVNTSMIIIGVLGLVFMLIKSFGIKKKVDG